MAQRTLKGRVAIVGIGETHYYKHGQSPDAEFKLALQAVLRACADAGLDPRHIDGFASYSNDRNDPSRLARYPDMLQAEYGRRVAHLIAVPGYLLAYRLVVAAQRKKKARYAQWRRSGPSDGRGVDTSV